jgi:NAD(P)H-flavin reductase
MNASVAPWVPHIYRVIRRVVETADTVTLEVAPESSRVSRCQPGQFNMLYAFGIGEIAVSASGDPQDDTKLVHTIRAVGAVSQALCSLEAGAPFGLRGPFGTAWPIEQARGQDVIVVAGGLGLAPLRPVLYHVLRHREQYRRVILLVGMRDPASILFQQQLGQWSSRRDVEVRVTLDRADATWHGTVGRVPALMQQLTFAPTAVIAMLCGPEIMMRVAADALRAKGIPTDRIYFSMERNMKCALGVCGRCQFGPAFICKDGPVLRLDRIAHLLPVEEI